MAAPPSLRMPKSLQTLGFLMREMPMMVGAQRKLGDVFTIHVHGLPPLVIVADPAIVKEIFTADVTQLHAGEGNAVLLPIVGPTSVLLLDEEPHLRQRKLMLAPLHGDRMRLYGEAMTQITDEEIDRWPLNQPMAMHAAMQAITLRVILRTVFGIDDGARLAELERLLPVMIDLGQWATMVPAIQRDVGGRTPWGRFLSAREEVDGILFDEIRRRHADPAATAERSDVLSLLMQARDGDGEPMADSELRDELLTMLVAGHETTATTMSWVFERLLRHPDALQRLRDDLHAGVRGTYLDAVIKETMRVRPVLNFAMRRLTRPLRVGGFDVPAGWQVAISLALVGLREDIYPEPLAWRPERFIERPPETYSWIPYGGGVRRCLGASFAHYEMTTVLHRVLSRCELRAAQPASEMRRRRAITHVPQHGTQVVVERRLEAVGTAAL
ncbi:MAG: cytochrome P450 [Solirubrobacterales bacterium]|nr:cytochrome P450 [Solirubrobacterales bacterium]